MTDICFYEAFEEEANELQRLLPEGISGLFTPQTIQESGDKIPPSRLISVRTQSQIPLDWAHQLEGILSRSTGFDHLREYASQVPQVPALGYLPLYCHRAVAEQALLLWLALQRRLKSQLGQFTLFHRDGLTGRESLGKTLVVVGVGHIGREICQIGQALQMKVLGVDLHREHPGLDYVTIDEALPQADILVCAMDLNDSNRGYFNLEKWSRIKPGAIFVNISRGELSPSTEILAALERGYLGGAGLDTFDHEPTLANTLRSGQPTDDLEALAAIALSQRADCLCTPHNAFNSVEAVARKSEHSILQVLKFLRDKNFIWPVPVATP